MKRVAIVIGTRPEAIKLAPVARALRASPDIDVRIIATAQHREMLDEALSDMGLVPDLDLDLMTPGQTLSAFSGRCVEALGNVFASERPDYVIGQGDTSTALSAALAAHQSRIPFGHVEAGLRSGAPDSPFPEETYRRLVSLLACHHFCPTGQAEANLLGEGIAADAIHVTGNTVVDSLLKTAATCDPPPIDRPRTILVTVHRRENFDALSAIAASIRTMLDRFADLRILWPIHPNPSLGRTIRAALGAQPRIDLTPPLPYRAFVQAMRDAALILTDSGGVQEEASVLGTPVLILRDETERPEGIHAGVARLVGNDPRRIVPAAAELLADEAVRASMARPSSPYGDGNAGIRIAAIVRDHLLGSIPIAAQLRSPSTSG